MSDYTIELLGEIDDLRKDAEQPDKDTKQLQTELDKLNKAYDHAIDGLMGVNSVFKKTPEFSSTVSTINKHIKECEALKGDK